MRSRPGSCADADRLCARACVRHCLHCQERAKAGGVYQLDEVGGYFDDNEHYKYIK